MAVQVDGNRIKAEIVDLMKKVDKDDPDPRDVAVLREVMRREPTVWKAAGDSMINSASHLIDSINATKMVKLSLIQGWESIQDDLGYAESSPLEQLLIQQVALSWLRLGMVEFRHTDTTLGTTSTSADYWDKRLNAAQRRFLRACETLARIRKINLQSVQINIARQQINTVTT